jgi:ribonuclease HI
MDLASLIIHSDGAARGNPGPAGAGAVIATADGSVRATVCEYLGEMTNNQAEYRALWFALEKARELGGRTLMIRADSELMVKQLMGEYRVKNPGLREVFDEIKKLLSFFASWKAEHVRREYNKDADRLANEAIDRHFKI